MSTTNNDSVSEKPAGVNSDLHFTGSRGFPLVQYSINAFANSLVFAVLFTVALFYLRENPKRLHSIIGGFVVELGQSPVLSWLGQEYSVWASKVLVLSVLFTPIIYILNNHFQPRCSHLFSKKSIKAAFPVWASGVIGYTIVLIAETSGAIAFPNRTPFWDWILITGSAVSLVKVYNWSLINNVAFADQKAVIPDAKTSFGSQFEASPRNPDTSRSELRIDSQKKKAFQQQEIFDWLESDDPTSIDMFGTRLKEKSQQLTSLIKNRRPDQRIQSIGIVGRHGAGKSSLIKHVREELCRDESFIFSHVSTWRFDESATAIHHILSEMIREVGTRIDTFRIRKLPDTYRKGFSSFGGEMLDKLSDMLFGDESLDSRLKKLDGMLLRSGSTLILIIEDLDRNDDSKFYSGQVQAFIHMLKSCSSVVTVIAGDPANSNKHKIDFEKLCDSTIDITLPGFAETSWLINSLKMSFVEQLPSNFNSTLESDELEYLQQEMYVSRYMKFPGLVLSIIRLLGNPRAIKHVLRRTAKSMNHTLNGEVDWDHLFIVNVLRSSVPRALYLADAYYNELVEGRFRSIPSQAVPGSANRDVSSANVLFLSEFEKIIGDRPIRSELETLMTFLFGSFPSETILKSRGSDWPPDKPQGVKSIRHWNRMFYESLEEGGSLDKTIVEDYWNWVNSVNRNFVVSNINQKEYSEGWESIVTHLNPGNLTIYQRLLDELVHECCEQADSDQFANADAVRIASEPYEEAIRAAIYEDRFGDRYGELNDFIERLIHRCAHSDLRVCCHLQEIVIRMREYDHDTYFKLLHRIPRIIQDSCAQAPSFTELLGRSDADVLFDLVFGWKLSNPSVQWEPPVDKWKWIGPELLQATRAGNEKTKLAVFRLLTHQERPFQGRYDVAMGNTLFGDDYPEIERIMDHEYPLRR